jgi:hypothetical protein
MPATLTDQNVIDTYALQMKQLLDVWPSLTQAGKSVDQCDAEAACRNAMSEYRRVQVRQILDQAVGAVGLPKVQVKIDTLVNKGASAEYNSSTNTLIFNKEKSVFDQRNLAEHEAIGLVGVSYHEIRHTEQAFQVAKLFATDPPDGKPRTAQQIRNELSIKIEIVEAAIRDARTNPLTAAQKQEAQAWDQSRRGSDRPQRVIDFQEPYFESIRQLNLQINTLKAAQQSLNALSPNDSGYQSAVQARDQARADYNQARTIYTARRAAYHKAFPQEEDAERVQQQAMAAYEKAIGQTRQTSSAIDPIMSPEQWNLNTASAVNALAYHLDRIHEQLQREQPTVISRSADPVDRAIAQFGRTIERLRQEQRERPPLPTGTLSFSHIAPEIQRVEGFSFDGPESEPVTAEQDAVLFEQILQQRNQQALASYRTKESEQPQLEIGELG